MYKPDNYNNKQNVEPKFSKTKTIPSKSFYLSSFPRCNKQQANFSFHFIGDFSGKCRKSKKLTMFQYWLDRDKPMNQQIGLSGAEPVLRFMVKFYIPDPSQLEEEYTRCTVISCLHSRAANDPFVFTITEKVPTRALSYFMS